MDCRRAKYLVYYARFHDVTKQIFRTVGVHTRSINERWSPKFKRSHIYKGVRLIHDVTNESSEPNYVNEVLNQIFGTRRFFT